jgi:hypothetical protein
MEKLESIEFFLKEGCNDLTRAAGTRLTFKIHAFEKDILSTNSKEL